LKALTFCLTVFIREQHFTDQSVLSVLKVLQQLPEGLATKVLAASPAELEDQLSILPPSMHPLAVHAAFPSIHCDHSLKLSGASFAGNSPTTMNAVPEAATTAPNYLKKFDLIHILKQDDTRLLQLISAACMSASDVSLRLELNNLQNVAAQQPAAPLHEALSHNTSLTCLKLICSDAPWFDISFDYIFNTLTGLQTLSLAKYEPLGGCSCATPLAAPIGIVNQLSLTHLCLGPGFHLMDLPQIIPHMAPLRFLDLRGDARLQPQELPDLSPLTALQTLKLDNFKNLNVLPSLAMLTTLQTLEVSFCNMLQQLPSLATLTALQTLKLCHLLRLLEVPPLDTLTALHTLQLRSCNQLQGIPSLAALTALQTLKMSDCGLMEQIPAIDTLTALQTLELTCFYWLQQLPSLETLTALQELSIQQCYQLLELPPLATLTALQTLDLRDCQKLERIPSLSTLTALQTIALTDCRQGLESTFQDTLPNTAVKIKRLR
jgi:Leucine-rich repeat (LRR) protein